MRKVLFICPCATKEYLSKLKYEKKYYILPLGVLSIVAYCKKNTVQSDVKLHILDFNTVKNEEITFSKMILSIKENIQNIKPDIVAVSVLFDSLVETLDAISSCVKEIDQNTLVICGGTATSISYQSILQKFPKIDAISFSEGEIPFSELLNAHSMQEELKSNGAFITREKLIDPEFQPEAKYIYDLDDIPPLPYHMLDMEGYDNSYNDDKGKKALVMHTARGCPFHCKFCTVPRIFGHKLRLMSAERVLQDLIVAVKKYGFEKISIFDEQLLAYKERAKEILNGIIDLDLQLEIDNGVNIALLDEEIVDILLRADIKRFVLSIESGSQYVLDHLMGKPVKLDRVKFVLPKLKKGKFYITSNFVIGMPGETDAHREETKDFILNSEIDWSVIFVAIPFKGSQLYDDCKEYDYFTYDDQGVLRVNTPEIHYKEMERQAYLLNLECNFVKNRAMRDGDYQKGKMLMERVKNKYTLHAFAHYYYAQCCLKLNQLSEYEEAMNCYFESISHDEMWKKYAELFQLPLSKNKL